jgi:micrococcal nuclease
MGIPRNALIPLISITIILLLGICHVVGASRTHVVMHVFDGDTIRLDDGRKIRLIGVDAPEVKSPYSEQEPFGQESKHYLSSLILHKKVTITLGDPSIDKFGRTLAYVRLGDVLVNGRIIRDGWARSYKRFHHPFRDLFSVYEREARSRGWDCGKGNRYDVGYMSELR